MNSWLKKSQNNGNKHTADDVEAAKYNEFWWTGRVVREGSSVGYIPTPEYLEILRRTKKLKPQIGGTVTAPDKAKLVDQFSTTSAADIVPCNHAKLDSRNNRTHAANPPRAKENRAKKKHEYVPFYYIAPIVRPIVVVGPSLKGFEVTDMMQKAIFDFIKHHFKGRVSMTRIESDISIAKRSAPSNPTKRSHLEKTLMEQRFDDINLEIERIYRIAQSLNLLVIDAYTIDHPEQLESSCLAPIVVALKIASPKVLQRLIKSRGKSQSRYMQAQLAAHEKLNKCNPQKIDLILDDNQLHEACQQLAKFLEAYWNALHPASPMQHAKEKCTQNTDANTNYSPSKII